jgi:hypothetical protein
MNNSRNLFFSIAPIAFFTFLTLFVLTGCTTRTTTAPARSATEELLLSTSMDRALTNADLSIFAHQKVFVDQSYFDSYDSKYAVGTVRDALSRAGALLMDTVTTADVIVEARSGAISIDASSSLFGIPSMGIPIPLAGTVMTPEVAFYKASRQHAYSKIALLAYVRQTGAHVYSSGALDGKSYNKYYDLLGASWRRTDIPEKKRPADRAKYGAWQPQYDPEALLAMPLSTNTPPATAAPTNAPPATTSSTKVPMATVPTNPPPTTTSVTNTPTGPVTNSSH